jgi:SAM-dependent methyltransferase
MELALIQRHYDDVIAPHYDVDPQSVIGDSLDRALVQIQEQSLIDPGTTPLRVLDVGMGTGRFLEKLNTRADRPIRRFGLDLSPKMIEVACARMPDLDAAVGDAANLEQHFQPLTFDLISTHFITGFVPINVLAPQIWSRLEPGGYWSLIGGTKAGFPTLQKKANARTLRWLFGGRKLEVEDTVSNPADRAEVVQTLRDHGFAICQCETFAPDLHFSNFREFLEFGYWGGWLTPFIERLGLHHAPPLLRLILNTLVFPVSDHHQIEIVLARKTPKNGSS